MPKILIVEDELPIADLIRLTLKSAGYLCDHAPDGDQAADLAAAGNYDLALVDVMLPRTDGFTLLEYFQSLELPVIFVTARSAVADRVKGLKLGAEDYIVKPFDVAELLARVETVLRRFHKTEETLSLAGVRVDPRARKVWRGEEEVSLTPKEYDLLLLFLHNPNAALYRDTIYERVWGRRTGLRQQNRGPARPASAEKSGLGKGAAGCEQDRLPSGDAPMKFRLKTTLCMVCLVSLLFGAGSCALISFSFQNALEREQAAARSAYALLVRTLQLVETVEVWSQPQDVVQVLQQLSAQGNKSWSALSLETRAGVSLPRKHIGWLLRPEGAGG